MRKCWCIRVPLATIFYLFFFEVTGGVAASVKSTALIATRAEICGGRFRSIAFTSESDLHVAWRSKDEAVKMCSKSRDKNRQYSFFTRCAVVKQNFGSTGSVTLCPFMS